jgi:hypothetical protein
MSPLLDTLLPFLFLILLGLIYRLRPAEGFPAEQVRKTIAALALQILFPCMAFRIMSEAPWDWNLIRVPTIAFFCTLGGVLAFALFRKAAGVFTNTSLRPSTWTALALASGWGNVTYLGIPLITAQFPSFIPEHPSRSDRSPAFSRTPAPPLGCVCRTPLGCALAPPRSPHSRDAHRDTQTCEFSASSFDDLCHRTRPTSTQTLAFSSGSPFRRNQTSRAPSSRSRTESCARGRLSHRTPHHF